MPDPELLVQQVPKHSRYSLRRMAGAGVLALVTIFGNTGCGLADRDHTTHAVSINVLEREARYNDAKEWAINYLHYQNLFFSPSEDEVFRLANHYRSRILYSEAIDLRVLEDETFVDRVGKLGSFQIYDSNGQPINYIPADVFELNVLQAGDALIRPKPQEPNSYAIEFSKSVRLDLPRVKIEAAKLKGAVDLANAELPPDPTPEEIAKRALAILETL